MANRGRGDAGRLDRRRIMITCDRPGVLALSLRWTPWRPAEPGPVPRLSAP